MPPSGSRTMKALIIAGITALAVVAGDAETPCACTSTDGTALERQAVQGKPKSVRGIRWGA
jgi:hypothetical protein